MPEIPELITRYETGLNNLESSVSGISPAHWDERIIEGQWTIRELICHLTDAEIVYVDRMKRVIVEDNPQFFEMDPNLFRTLSFGRNPVSEVQHMALLREQMATILKQCDIEAFQRTGVHSAEGPMTLETLLERITEHIPHHQTFLAEKIRQLTAKSL